MHPFRFVPLLALALAGCEKVETCDDGEDNDGDGFADCLDQDCQAECAEVCDDAFDNDGDGAIDCEDDDCDGGCDEDCYDGRDNDGDGATDCEDDDCDDGCAEDCTDSRDNDGDGATDCADTDCDGSCPEVCDDLRDNDGDGKLDCEDGDCATDAACLEDCDSGDDEDGDGLVDCDDDDCWGAGCEVYLAKVTGGSMSGSRYKQVQRGYFRSTYTMSSVPMTYTFAWHQDYDVVDVYAAPLGTVRRLTSSGAIDTCSWSAGAVHLKQTHMNYSSIWGEAHRIDRPPLSLESGCPFTTTGFLPQRIELNGPRVDLLDGRSWYLPATLTSSTYFTSGFDSTTVSHMFSSGYWLISSTTWSAPSLATGATYVTLP